MKRVASIRSSLAKLVAACRLPAPIAAAVLLYYSYQRMHADLANDALAKAHAQMLTVDREFEGADRSLRALATSPYLQYWDMASLHEQTVNVLKGNNINGIVLINSAGQQVLNTASQYGSALPMSTNFVQLERVITLGQSDVSDLFVTPLPSGLAINVAIPVRVAGQVTHSLVGVVLPMRLQEILLENRLPPNRIAAIFDGARTIAARTHDVERFRGKSITSALFEQVKSKKEGMFETVSLETDAALKGSERRMRGIVLSAMHAIITVDDSQIVVLLTLRRLPCLAALSNRPSDRRPRVLFPSVFTPAITTLCSSNGFTEAIQPSSALSTRRSAGVSMGKNFRWKCRIRAWSNPAISSILFSFATAQTVFGPTRRLSAATVTCNSLPRSLRTILKRRCGLSAGSSRSLRGTMATSSMKRRWG